MILLIGYLKININSDMPDKSPRQWENSSKSLPPHIFPGFPF